MKPSTYFFVFLLSIVLVGCSSSNAVHVHSESYSGAKRSGHWHRTEMYFGMNKQLGSVVTDDEFTEFVDQVITPRFPNGLTVVKAAGQWQSSSSEIVKEKSRIVILFHRFSTKTTQGIAEIANAYKRQHAQESVLIVTEETTVHFH